MEKLKEIIAKMIKNGEPDHVIKAVVSKYKKLHPNEFPIQTAPPTEVDVAVAEPTQVQTNQDDESDEYPWNQPTQNGLMPRSIASQAGPSSAFVPPGRSDVPIFEPKEKKSEVNEFINNSTKSYNNQGFSFEKEDKFGGSVKIITPKGKKLHFGTNIKGWEKRAQNFIDQNQINDEEKVSRDNDIKLVDNEIENLLRDLKDDPNFDFSYWNPEKFGGKGTEAYNREFLQSDGYQHFLKTLKNNVNNKLISGFIKESDIEDLFERRIAAESKKDNLLTANKVDEAAKQEITEKFKEGGDDWNSYVTKSTENTKKELWKTNSIAQNILQALQEKLLAATTTEEKQAAQKKIDEFYEEIESGGFLKSLSNWFSDVHGFQETGDTKPIFDIYGNVLPHGRGAFVQSNDLNNSISKFMTKESNLETESARDFYLQEYDKIVWEMHKNNTLGAEQIGFTFSGSKWWDGKVRDDVFSGTINQQKTINDLYDMGAKAFDSNGEEIKDWKNKWYGGYHAGVEQDPLKIAKFEAPLLKVAEYKDRLFLGDKSTLEKSMFIFDALPKLIEPLAVTGEDIKPTYNTLEGTKFTDKTFYEFIDTYSNIRKELMSDEIALRNIAVFNIDPSTYNITPPDAVKHVGELFRESDLFSTDDLDFKPGSVKKARENTLNYIDKMNIKIPEKYREKLGGGNTVSNFFYEYGLKTGIQFTPALIDFAVMDALIPGGGAISTINKVKKIGKYINKLKTVKKMPVLRTIPMHIYGIGREEAKMRYAFEDNYHLGAGFSFYTLGLLGHKYFPLEKLTGSNRLNTFLQFPKSGLIFAASAEAAKVAEAGWRDLTGGETIKTQLDNIYKDNLSDNNKDFMGNILFGAMLAGKRFRPEFLGGPKYAWSSGAKMKNTLIEAEESIIKLSDEKTAIKNKWKKGAYLYGGKITKKAVDMRKELERIDKELQPLLETQFILENRLNDLTGLSALDVDKNGFTKNPVEAEKWLRKNYHEELESLKVVNNGDPVKLVFQRGRKGMKTDGNAEASGIGTPEAKVIFDLKRTQLGKFSHEVGHFITTNALKSSPKSMARFVNLMEGTFKGQRFDVGKDKNGNTIWGDLREFIKTSYKKEIKEGKVLSDEEFISYTFELLSDYKNYAKLVKENANGLSTWTLLKQAIIRTGQEHGFKPTFDFDTNSKRQLVLFIGNIAQSLQKGKLSSEQLKKIEEIGTSDKYKWLDEPINHNPDNATKQRVNPLGKAVGYDKNKASKDLNSFSNELQKIYNSDKVEIFGVMQKINPDDKAYFAMMQYDPRLNPESAGSKMIMNRLARHEGRSGYKTFKTEIIDQILTGERGVLSIIKTYDPKKNDKLSAYVSDIGFSKKYRNVVADAVNKYLGKDQQARPFTRSVEDQDLPDIMDISDRTGRDIKIETPKKEIKKEKEGKFKKKEIEELYISKKGRIETKDPLPNTSRAEVEKWLPKININKEGSLKAVEGKVAKGINKIFNVENKPGNLSIGEINNALKKADKLAPVIERIMPEGYIPLKGIKDIFGKTYKPSEILKGKGMGIRKSLPDLYEKGAIKGDVISEKTGRVKTAAGIDPHRKIANTNGEIIRKILEIDKLEKHKKDIKKRGISKGDFIINTATARRLSPKIKTILKWIDKNKTAQIIKENPDLIQFPDAKSRVKITKENIIADYAAGKDNSLASKPFKIFIDEIVKNKLPINTTSDFISIVNRSSLSDENKKLIINEIPSAPRYIVESKEFQKEWVKNLEDAEVLSKIILNDGRQWRSVKTSLEKALNGGMKTSNKKYVKLNINGIGIIKGNGAYNIKLDHDVTVLKSLPKFDTLPKKVQNYILDQLGIGYIKFTTADYMEKYNAYHEKDKKGNYVKSKKEREQMIKNGEVFLGKSKDGEQPKVRDYFRLRRGDSPIETIKTHYATRDADVLKGNGKTYKGEFDAAHWARKISVKELKERLGDDVAEGLKLKSGEIKDVIADLSELYTAKEINIIQYHDYARRILKHENFTYKETHKANQNLIKAILKPFYEQYQKAKGKGKIEEGEALSAIINHFAPQTNIGTGISKGFYTITSVPLNIGKPHVTKKGKIIRTHNEHELPLINFNKFFIEILTNSKNKTEFNSMVDHLVSMGEQSIIPKWLQRFNDSKEGGGQAGTGDLFNKNLAGLTKLIFLTKKGVGDNQLYLLADKPMTLNEFIIDQVKLSEIKKILSTFGKNEKTNESVNLEKKVKYPEEKVKSANLKLAKHTGVYHKASKDISNSELTKVLQDKARAIAKARDPNAPLKGASILDFDDTVAKTKSMIAYEIPKYVRSGAHLYGVFMGKVPAKGKLTPAEFAERHAELKKRGAIFDFSEFNKIIGGKKGPLFEKLQKIQSKYGTENTFILTARPQEAALAIKKFLEGLGVNIPLKNIRGLEDGNPGAKANFIIEKGAEGYNDFYFVDDVIQNVRAVKNAVNLLGANGKIRQAITRASKDLNKEFHKILKETKGIEEWKKFSKGTAKTRGADIGKWQWWLPPSAQGFLDLMYPTFGKGKQGDGHMKWFDKTLGRPYAQGFYELNKSKQRVQDDYEALKKQYPNIKKIVNKDSGYHKFTNDAAMRVYLWNKNKMDIPELSKRDVTELVKLVKSNPELQSYADQISKLTQLKDGYVKPSESWLAKSIQHDLLDVSNKVGRKQFFAEWINNKNAIFTEATLNKLEATFGSKYRSALEDMLYRMEHGHNVQRKSTDAEKRYSKWIANATGTVMFLNRRSALTQSISMLNFMNWKDNGPIDMGRAFANQKQFWKDFAMIWNSPMLKQRRRGLTMDVNYEEIVSTMEGKKDKVSAGVSYMLHKGFVFTKIVDNWAIAFGGATMYRNRLNTYLKHTKDKVEAKKKAFLDFQEVSEPTQQSSRPDLISQEQASPWGRFLLTFQNVTMQNNRNGKRAVLDLVNRRGDMKTNLSKIVYYFGVQNMIFLGMQQALFASYWDDDATDEDRTKKHLKIGNGMLDVYLRGGGMYGVGIATIKNTILKYMEESKKGWKGSEAKVLVEALNLSPPVGAKIRKIHNAMVDRKYNKDSIVKPLVLAAEGATNIPFHEFFEMVDSGVALTDAQLQAWQKVAIALGYPEWQVDYKPAPPPKKKKKKKKYNPFLIN